MTRCILTFKMEAFSQSNGVVPKLLEVQLLTPTSTSTSTPPPPPQNYHATIETHTCLQPPPLKNVFLRPFQRLGKLYSPPLNRGGSRAGPWGCANHLYDWQCRRCCEASPTQWCQLDSEFGRHLRRNCEYRPEFRGQQICIKILVKKIYISYPSDAFFIRVSVHQGSLKF